ncbi:MAG: type II secretion system protein GspM [Gammaproteobacteria bacterium]
MKNLIERIEALLQQLAPRERVMVLVGAAVVVVTLLYLVVWQPLAAAHTQRQAALERARALSARIEQAAAQVRATSPGRRVDRELSLLAAVDQTSRSPTLGKAPSRLQPEGDREVKVWLEDVAFDSLLRWLQELETRYGISASSAEIERSATPGQVSVRLTLVRP